MDIGRFYMESNKYIAAMNRFKKVIDYHSESKFTPEALYRLVEIYYKLGMKKEAINTAAVIGYNYPNSKWYEYSYELVGEKDDESCNFSFSYRSLSFIVDSVFYKVK